MEGLAVRLLPRTIALQPSCSSDGIFSSQGLQTQQGFGLRMGLRSGCFMEVSSSSTMKTECVGNLRRLFQPLACFFSRRF